LPDPEDIGIYVGNLLLSCTQVEINNFLFMPLRFVAAIFEFN